MSGAVLIGPADLAILLVSLVACGYCALLSRRLKALQSTRDGLGSTIITLSRTLATLSNSSQGTKDEMTALAARLETLIQEGKAGAEELSALLKRIADAKEATAASLKATHDELAAALGETSQTALREARDLNRELQKLEAAVQSRSSSPLGRSMDKAAPGSGSGSADGKLRLGRPSTRTGTGG